MTPAATSTIDGERQDSVELAAQLQRRREAAARLPPLPSGHRDPWARRSDAPDESYRIPEQRQDDRRRCELGRPCQEWGASRFRAERVCPCPTAQEAVR